MARFKTFVNGGNMLPGDLDSIEDDYECAFSTYKSLGDWSAGFSAPASGVYLFAASGMQFPNAALSSGSPSVRWLDPARYWSIAGTSSTNPRTPQCNLSFGMLTNATAVGTVTFTVGLYAVASSAGGAGAINLTLAGAPVTGSTVAIVNPAASSLITTAHSGDFVAPAAGYYAVAVAVSASATFNSEVLVTARLSMRQV